MYKFILTALLNIGGVCLFAQFSAIEIETNNVLYSGVRNKISIAAENTSCKFLVVKTTNGSISGGNCQFIYSINFDSAKNNFITKTEIEVYRRNQKNKLKLLTSKVFIIKQIPDPVACVLSCNNSQVSYLYFQNSRINDGLPKSPDIRAEVPLNYGLPFDCRFIVDSFYISIFREDSCITTPILNKGNYFTDEVYEVFKQLRENDKIVFDKIYAKGSDGSKRLLKSFNILISK